MNKSSREFHDKNKEFYCVQCEAYDITVASFPEHLNTCLWCISGYYPYEGYKPTVESGFIENKPE